MQYPSFLKANNTIGICAPSQGVGHKIEDLEKSIAVFNQKHWHTIETASVRNDANPSTSATIRAEELNQLIQDPTVDFIMCATGGDFLFEILPYVNFKHLASHPKWIMGASDPTGLLFPITTKYDVATIYGFNACNFDDIPLQQYTLNCLEVINGNLVTQTSSEKVLSKPPFLAESMDFDMPSPMSATISSLHTSGRCIGGCIDVLKDLIGTAYDSTNEFIERYQDDGIIWYFDNFSLSAEMFYRTLLQMQYAGYFKHTKAVLIGRDTFPSSETGFTYLDGIQRVFKEIPVIYQADIGHHLPHMAMINGAMMDVDYEEKQLSISFRLE